MGELYHGSSVKGITRLEPNSLTHGKYVYATPYKELAIIFSGKSGDKYKYALYRNNENEPWQMVERIPGAFDTMFSNSASIYTLDDVTFIDLHTGFSEVVSEVGVNINNEEFLPNVYDEIKKLKEGKIQLYLYPNKPKEIPQDSSDLIDEEIKYNSPVTRQSFERLVLLHPYLIDKINQKMIELNLNTEPYTKEDLISLFSNAVINQAIEPDREQYLKSIVISITSIYPDLLPRLNEKLSFFEKTREEKISFLIDELYRKFDDIPMQLVQQVKEKYFSDARSFSQIGKEIMDFSRKMMLAEQIINMPISQEILENSILLIGPMGAGKSTISKRLSEVTDMPRISLDDRKQLQNFYQNRVRFTNFKDFEFYLTSGVLTSIKEPSIIDFGAGHSIYENPIMFYEMQKLIKRFNNIELILPSENMDESLKIINKRISSRGKNISEGSFDLNKHFIKSHCNYELASDIIYTQNMTIAEIADLILKRIICKNIEKSGSIRK